MRKTLLLVTIVLLSVAWVAGQQQEGGAPPASQSSSPTMNSGQAPTPGAPGAEQRTPPSAPPSSADQSAPGNSQMIEGCLGGSAPDFTVTDKAGTVYKLDIPKEADTAPLTAHLGQSVRVQGAVSGTGTAGASGSTPETGKSDKPAGSASTGKLPIIQAERISAGSGTCPAGAAKPTIK